MRKSIKLLGLITFIFQVCGTAPLQAATRHPEIFIIGAWNQLSLDNNQARLFSETQSPTFLNTAYRLATLPRPEYLAIQKRHLGRRLAACNLFFFTVMMESGLETKTANIRGASHIDSYLIKRGWRQITIHEAKKILKESENPMIVFTRDARTNRRGRNLGHGHVMIGAGLNGRGEILVAEGQLNGDSNNLNRKSDKTLTKWRGGYKIFTP